ncbi:MAG: penicillin acylase family protein [Caldilineales bacterium]|nr:penicillin acylase family protein [Caldilineales bacterium]MDW8319010.1 penicillin acylase family protein [Anaerolineae bacterium]
MSIGFQLAIAALTLAGLLLALVAGLFWFIFGRTLAKHKGETELPGLQAPVEIVRDRWGVPHIYAESEADAFFAQGFVHAQDRLFQMEFSRRLARGTLAERLGLAALEADRWSRVLGFWRAVQADAAALEAEERAALEAYAAGVNAFLETHRYRLPAEFTLLGYKPDPWTVEDSLGVLKLMGWALGQNWEGELLRVQLVQRLGVERALELDPFYPAGHPTVLPEGPVSAEALAELAGRLLDSYRNASAWFGQAATAGSNNWVVAGRRTVTRRPLLANDPHLSVGIPTFWYQAHLTARDGSLEVAGATLAGVPGVIIGHNRRIAWGITAGRADSQDLFLEQRHPDRHGPLRFRFGDDWEPAQVLEERIAVRGRAEPHVEQVVITRHGPLINTLLGPSAQGLPDLALCWTGHFPSRGVRGLLRLQRATDWQSFRAALADVGEPSMNVVYADVDGHIGYHYAARVPRRRWGFGLVPTPGWDERYGWDGWVPFDALPHALDPEQGYLISANNKPALDNQGAEAPFLGADWLPGYRALRIERMLQGKPRFSVRDFAAMQMDVYSVEAEALLPHMISVDSDQPMERRIVRELDAWNLRVEMDSFAAAAYEVMRLHLMDLVFGDKLGDLAQRYKGKTHSDIFTASAFGGKAGMALARLLEQEESWWFADAAAGRPRTRDELLREALRRTAATLYDLIGKDPRKWAWGKVHQVEFAHLLAGGGRLLRAIFSRGQFPVSGDEHTVWMTAFDLQLPFGLVTVSATYRQVLDVGDWDRSTAVLSTGQSGQPFSEHYADMIDMWREGEQHPMLWSRQAVQSQAKATLWLRPVNGKR